MAQRGQQTNSEGTGASKKNNSVQKQSQTRRNSSPKNKISGNQDQSKRRNPENQGKDIDKNNDTWPNKKTKRHRPHKTNQIGNRTDQLARKNTMESVKKKLMLQFGFVANPSHSNHHNDSNVLANTPTWYFFSRPSHLAFHDFTKNMNNKKPTLTARPGTRIHPNTNPNKLLDMNMIEIVQPSLQICTPSIPFRW